LSEETQRALDRDWIQVQVIRPEDLDPEILGDIVDQVIADQ
jgi:hypothetical protein